MIAGTDPIMLCARGLNVFRYRKYLEIYHKPIVLFKCWSLFFFKQFILVNPPKLVPRYLVKGQSYIKLIISYI